MWEFLPLCLKLSPWDWKKRKKRKAINITDCEWWMCTCGFLSYWRGTYGYSLRELSRWRAQSGFPRGQTPLPPGYPAASWRRAFVPWNSCLSRILELLASRGCQQCPQSPVSMETRQICQLALPPPPNHNLSLMTKSRDWKTNNNNYY